MGFCLPYFSLVAQHANPLPYGPMGVVLCPSALLLTQLSGEAAQDDPSPWEHESSERFGRNSSLLALISSALPVTAIWGVNLYMENLHFVSFLLTVKSVF